MESIWKERKETSCLPTSETSEQSHNYIGRLLWWLSSPVNSCFFFFFSCGSAQPLYHRNPSFAWEQSYNSQQRHWQAEHVSSSLLRSSLFSSGCSLCYKLSDFTYNFNTQNLVIKFGCISIWIKVFDSHTCLSQNLF